MRSRFGKCRRLTTKREFDRVFQGNLPELRLGRFRALMATNDAGHPRLGIVVPKRAIAGAVGRNRVKRIIRESFRGVQDSLPALDLVVVARQGSGFDQTENSALCNMLDGIWAQAPTKERSA